MSPHFPEWDEVTGDQLFGLFNQSAKIQRALICKHVHMSNKDGTIYFVWLPSVVSISLSTHGGDFTRIPSPLSAAAVLMTCVKQISIYTYIASHPHTVHYKLHKALK